MTPRLATPADLPAIARLHMANWRRDYARLLPATALGEDLPRFMARLWTEEAAPLSRTWVLADSAGLIGFALCAHNAESGLYVASLHVDAKRRGKGAGRALMAALAAQAGDGPISLEVLAGNHAARAVYRHWHGVESAPFAETMLGASVESCKVTWAEASTLAARLAALAEKKSPRAAEGA